MGIYKLSIEEIQDELEDFFDRLEGDFDIKDICKAFNNIAKKEYWIERICLKEKK